MFKSTKFINMKFQKTVYCSHFKCYFLYSSLYNLYHSKLYLLNTVVPAIYTWLSRFKTIVRVK